MGRRQLFTTKEFYRRGTQSELRWRVEKKKCVRVHRTVYAHGAGAPTPFERSLARMMVADAPAWGLVAGELHEFDGIELHVEVEARLRRRRVDETDWFVDGYWCTSPLQTLIDLASLVDDDVWEQSLEFALRKKLVDLDELTALVPMLSKTRHHGVGHIRRVLARRPTGAKPTESMLETLMVQVARLVPGLPPPIRQFVVDEDGRFVARVDLCWPELGIFLELDGEGHRDQPVHDAARQTDVAATTGWLCGRFSWTEVRQHPRASAARLARLAEQARQRPVAQF